MTVGVAGQGAGQPAGKQTMIQFRGVEHAEAADNEGVLCQPQLFSARTFLHGLGRSPHMGNDAQRVGQVRAVPPPEQFPGKLGVDNDAPGLPQHGPVGGIPAFCRFHIPIALLYGQIAMAGVQRGIPGVGPMAVKLQPGKKPAEEEVMEDDGPGNVLQQGQHVDMEGRIPHVVDDAFKCVGVRPKPCDIVYRAVVRQPGVVDLLLLDDDGDVVEACQGRYELATVVRDAGLLWRQRGNIGELRFPFLAGFGHGPGLGCFVQGLPCGQGLLRGAIPGKSRCLLEAVLAQAAAQRVVFKGLDHLVGHGSHVEGVEISLLAGDGLRQAGAAGGNQRRAAGHGFQRRQAKAFMPGGKNEQVAEVIEPDNLLVRHVAGKTKGFRGETVVRRQGLELLHERGGNLAREHQLVGGVQARRQGGECLDQARQIFALIVTTGIQQEGTGDAEFGLESLLFLAAEGHLPKERLHRGADIADVFTRNVEVMHPFLARIFGVGQQQIRTLEMLELVPIVPVVFRIWQQVQIRVGQGDEVVENDRYRGVAVKSFDAGDRVVLVAFEQAAKMDDVGLETGQEGFAQQFRPFPARLVAWLLLPDRSGGGPDANMVLWNQFMEFFSNIRNRVRKEIV